MPLPALGERVRFRDLPYAGIVRFAGDTKFKEGPWVGIEIEVPEGEEPKGKHNGTVMGVEYFTCPEKHGIFVRPTAIRPFESTARASQGNPQVIRPSKVMIINDTSEHTSVPLEAVIPQSGCPSMLGAVATSTVAQIAATPKTVAEPLSAGSGLAPPVAPGGQASAAVDPAKHCVSASQQELHQSQQKQQRLRQQQKFAAEQVASLKADLQRLTNELTQCNAEYEKEKALFLQATRSSVVEHDETTVADSYALALESNIAGHRRVEALKIKLASVAEETQNIKASQAEVTEKFSSLGALDLEGLKLRLEEETARRELAEMDFESLELDVDEARLSLEEIVHTSSKRACRRNGSSSEKILGYQEALRALNAASCIELQDLENAVESLDSSVGFVFRLAKETETLQQKQHEVAERLVTLDATANEYQQVRVTDRNLQQATDELESALAIELDVCLSRSAGLERLVMALEKDRREVSSIVRERTTQLSELVSKIQEMSEIGTNHGMTIKHALVLGAELRKSMADIDACTVAAAADVYKNCIPPSWVARNHGSDGCGERVASVLCRSQIVAVLERCLCKTQLLVSRVCAERLEDVSLDETLAVAFCRLCSSAASCSDAAASVLWALSDPTLEERLPEPLTWQVEPAWDFVPDEELLDALIRQCCSTPPSIGDAGSAVLQSLHGKFSEFAKRAAAGSKDLPVVCVRRLEAAFRCGLTMALRLATDAVPQGKVLASSLAAIRKELNFGWSCMQEKLDACRDAALGDGSGILWQAGERDDCAKVLRKLQIAIGDVISSVTENVPEKEPALQIVKWAVDEMGSFLEILDGAGAILYWKGVGKEGILPWEAVFLRRVLGWTSCCAEVCGDMKRICQAVNDHAHTQTCIADKHSELEETQAKVKDMQDSLGAKKEQVDVFKKRSAKIKDLEEESALLQAQAKTAASAHASLRRDVDRTQAMLENQERMRIEAQSKRDEWERKVRDKKDGTQHEKEGRVTAAEFAMLQHVCAKTATELYARQVNSIADLEPLQDEQTILPGRGTLDHCISGYAECRRGLMQEWSSARVIPLGPNSQADQSAALAKLQRLQLKLVEVRGDTGAMAKPTAKKATTVMDGEAASEPTLSIKLAMIPPPWASAPPSAQAYAVSYDEVRHIHRSVH